MAPDMPVKLLDMITVGHRRRSLFMAPDMPVKLLDMIAVGRR